MSQNSALQEEELTERDAEKRAACRKPLEGDLLLIGI
jgi:hypothetical protein